MDEIKIGEILEPGSQDEQRSNERTVRQKFWLKLRQGALSLPYIDMIVAAYYCALDPETPSRVRITLLAALAYFIMPFDFMPDFILGLGFTDDIAVLMAAIGAVRESITDAHRAAAREALEKMRSSQK